jgi:hypothetical protein
MTYTGNSKETRGKVIVRRNRGIAGAAWRLYKTSWALASTESFKTKKAAVAAAQGLRGVKVVA